MPQQDVSSKKSQITTTLMSAINTPYILSPKQRILTRVTIVNLALTILCNCLLVPCILVPWFPRYTTLAITITLGVTILELLLVLLTFQSQQTAKGEVWVNTQERETEALFKLGTTAKHKAIERIRTKEVPVEDVRMATALLERYTNASTKVTTETRVTGARDRAILAQSHPFRVGER